MDSRCAVSFRPFDPCSTLHVHSHEPHIPHPPAAARLTPLPLPWPQHAPYRQTHCVSADSAGYLVTPLWAVLRRHWKRGEDNSLFLQFLFYLCFPCQIHTIHFSSAFVYFSFCLVYLSFFFFVLRFVFPPTPTHSSVLWPYSFDSLHPVLNPRPLPIKNEVLFN